MQKCSTSRVLKFCNKERASERFFALFSFQKIKLLHKIISAAKYSFGPLSLTGLFSAYEKEKLAKLVPRVLNNSYTVLPEMA